MEQWINFNGDGKTWIKVNELLILDPINGDQKQYVKDRITRLEHGVLLEWYTNGMADKLTLNGFHADG
jgi:hypothetical protein